MHIILSLLGLVMLICEILVLIKMFQDDQIVLGILGIFCFLVPLVVGWQNARRWNIQKVMMIWTVLLLVGIVLDVVFVMMVGMHR